MRPLALLLALSLQPLGCRGGERSPAQEPAPPPAAGERPNLLVLLPDSMRADRPFATRDGEPVAPRLQALADRGARFERCTSSAGWTIPALSAAMTGRHARLPRPHEPKLGWEAESKESLPEVLGLYGYQSTAFVGAHSGGLEAVFSGRFDAVVRASGEQPREQGASAELADWLEAGPQEPFLAFVHDVDLRFVIEPDELAALPGASAACAEHRSRSGEPKPLEMEDLRACLELDDAAAAALIGQRYDDTIRAWDEGLGLVLAALEGSGLDQRTVIVLASPHGHHLGEHGRFGHSTLYEPDLRVPLLWVEPDGGVAGQRLDPLVQLLDLTPSLLARAGATLPVGLDGASLLPLLGLAEGSYAERDAFAFNDATSFALRADGLELQRLHPSGGQRGPIRHELYDLGVDPGEDHDLWSDPPPPRAAPLHQRLLEFEGQVRAAMAPPGPAAHPPHDDPLRQHLRDEGYWKHVEPGRD